MQDDIRAFFYVDGIPTKGLWVDIDDFTDWDTVSEALAEGGFIPRNEDDEPEYGGDVLCACYEGPLIGHFHGAQSDILDLDGLIECIDDCDRNNIDYDNADAYISWAGDWDVRRFQECFCGTWSSKVDYAESYVDDVMSIPQEIAPYFDYEKFANDLFIDYYFDDDTGAVFRSC